MSETWTHNDGVAMLRESPCAWSVEQDVSGHGSGLFFGAPVAWVGVFPSEELANKARDIVNQDPERDGDARVERGWPPRHRGESRPLTPFLVTLHDPELHENAISYRLRTVVGARKCRDICGCGKVSTTGDMVP